MAALKKKFKPNILTAILVLLVLNLAVLDIVLLKDGALGKVTAFLSERSQKVERETIFEKINPSQGYELNIEYGDLGPRMLSMGVIDLEKFTNLYQGRGGMGKDETEILTRGSKKRIKITRENSGFLLNFFWAAGLANKTRILTEGQMQSYGGNPGNFASTGGWTLSLEESMNYYSKSELFKLTESQEQLVEKVASGIFRPCCDNSTAFPDCNHGMALLGVLELMASNGASEAQMFEAAKYFNAFWFPTNYYDLAKYFKLKDGTDFDKVSAATILGKDYSSAIGYYNIKKWLEEKEGKVQQEEGGASCGV